jgi:hypothetical protein
MATLRIGGMVAKVLPSAPQTGGTARRLAVNIFLISQST